MSHENKRCSEIANESEILPRDRKLFWNDGLDGTLVGRELIRDSPFRFVRDKAFTVEDGGYDYESTDKYDAKDIRYRVSISNNTERSVPDIKEA